MERRAGRAWRPPAPTAVAVARVRRRCASGSRRATAITSTCASTRRSPAWASPASDWDKPPSELSAAASRRAPRWPGCWSADPDLLLLDEPTNHLDVGAIEWLEQALVRRARRAARRLARPRLPRRRRDRIWELRDRRLEAFRGGYSAYLLQRESGRRAGRKEADDGHGADRPRARAGAALPEPSQVRQDARARAAPRGARGAARRGAAPRRRRWRSRTAASSAAARSAPATWWSACATRVVGFPATAERPAGIAHRAHRRGSRPGAATASASSGPTAPARPPCCAPSPASCRRSTASSASGRNVQPGYLAQVRDRASRGATVLDALLAQVNLDNGPARSYLARFLFRGEDVFKPVAELSGGERSRLELALLGITPANLLLLDEPTNHLDIPAREALESFLRESPATLLVVSHDRRLLETVCDRLWVVEAGADGAARPRGRLRRRASRLARRGRRRLDRRRRARGPVAPARHGRDGRAATGTEPRHGAATGPRRRGHAIAAASAVRRLGHRTARVARRPARALSKDAYRRQKARHRGRPDPARRCARASSSWRSATGHPGQLRGAAPGLAASWPTSTPRSARPRRPGCCSRSAAPTMSRRHRADRAHRLRQVDRRRACSATWAGMVIDADALARAVTGPGRPTLPAIRARFGDAVFDDRGELDRAALAASSSTTRPPRATSRRSSIPPSALRSRPARRPPEAGDAPFVVIEAIKLVEGGLAERCDEVWLVGLRPADARERLRRRGHGRRRRRAAHRRPGRHHERTAPAATRILRTDGRARRASWRRTDELLRARPRARATGRLRGRLAGRGRPAGWAGRTSR